MKILHVGKFWPPTFGGIESIHFGLHHFLNANKIQCLSLVFDNGAVQEDFVIKSKYFKIFGNIPFSVSYIVFLFRNIRCFDILHFHFPNPIVIFIFLFYRKKLPIIVVHWHSDLVKGRVLNAFYNYIVRKYVLIKSDTIIVTSSVYGHSSKCLKRHLGRVVVIPNFLNLSMGSYDHTVKNILDSRNIKLISVGRNTFYKGFNLIVGLMDYLPLKFSLTIIGKDSTKIFVPEHLKSRVFLIEGYSRSDLEQAYKGSDIFVLGSHTRAEAFGVVLLEAMSFSLPTVSFHIEGSGVLEVVENSATGFLVDNGNIVQLAKRIMSLVEDEELYSTMSHKAFNRSKKYSIDSIGPSFIEEYNYLFDNR